MNADPGIITCEVFIAARPETVFGFLIDPVLMARWIGLSHVLEPHPGGLFQVEVSSGNVARGVYNRSRWSSASVHVGMPTRGRSIISLRLKLKPF